MPKKQQRNAFYFFMKERQDMYSAQGRRVSMNELVVECHPIYKNLTPLEREPYEQMAKDYKKKGKDTMEGHLCSDGTAIALNNQAEVERRETLENEMKAVQRIVFEKKSMDEVADKAFYVICFNVLCRTDYDDFIPNEVGIVRYSLRGGLEEHYHCFIDPGAIPLGYTHASKQHSDETHMIPISGFELANSDYRTVYKEILRFVNPTSKGIAPVFSLQENLEQNRGCLQWLSIRADMEDTPIYFHDITYLLMELRAYANKPFPSRAVVVDILSKNSFDYIPNTRCSFHEELDNAYCALGCAKRLCFILSDALCALYQVDCTPKHLPPRMSDKTQMKTAQPIFPQSRLFIPPKLPMQYANPSQVPDICTTVEDSANIANDSKINHGQSWFKEFRQPQPDVNTDFPSQNNAKPVKSEEMRQPFTIPYVLNQALCQSKIQYALLGRGRGIGRGKQPPGN